MCVNISLKFANLCLIYMQVTFITTILYAKAKFCICCTKVNTDFFSDASVLSLISSVGPSPNTKKLFFWLLV